MHPVFTFPLHAKIRPGVRAIPSWLNGTVEGRPIEKHTTNITRTDRPTLFRKVCRAKNSQNCDISKQRCREAR